MLALIFALIFAILSGCDSPTETTNTPTPLCGDITGQTFTTCAKHADNVGACQLIPSLEESCLYVASDGSFVHLFVNDCGKCEDTK